MRVFVLRRSLRRVFCCFCRCGVCCFEFERGGKGDWYPHRYSVLPFPLGQGLDTIGEVEKDRQSIKSCSGNGSLRDSLIVSHRLTIACTSYSMSLCSPRATARLGE